ncbi:MAG: TatD family hydrolase [Bacteroidetes bacterium]|nr:TatD family hydrolase [Bacteroidota bacterium]
MNLIDTHAHIYQEDFQVDIDAVIARAKENGVSKIYLPNVDVPSIADLKALVQKDPLLFIPMMGLHPCYVKDDFEVQLNTIEKELRSGNYVAVGEIGIDLYWDKTFYAQQQEAFRRQIDWALELDLPIVIHARDSLKEIYEIMDEVSRPQLKGIFHCFSGNADDARKVINYGFKIGIGGVVTFKNSGLDKVLQEIDIKHIVIETDAPYLTPVPHRGKRNESSYVKLIAIRLAEIYGISLDEVAEITTQNAKEVFNFEL